MKRETESTSRIKRICSTVGVHYTNKTYNNLRTILRIHSMVKKDWSLIEANIKKCGYVNRSLYLEGDTSILGKCN